MPRRVRWTCPVAEGGFLIARLHEAGIDVSACLCASIWTITVRADQLAAARAVADRFDVVLK